MNIDEKMDILQQILRESARLAHDIMCDLEEKENWEDTAMMTDVWANIDMQASKISEWEVKKLNEKVQRLMA